MWAFTNVSTRGCRRLIIGVFQEIKIIYLFIFYLCVGRHVCHKHMCGVNDNLLELVLSFHNIGIRA